MKRDSYLIEMGKRIKAIRKEARMSQQALADLCGIDDASVCLIEGGRSNAHILTLKAIAENLNVDVKDFI